MPAYHSPDAETDAISGKSPPQSAWYTSCAVASSEHMKNSVCVSLSRSTISTYL